MKILYLIVTCEKYWGTRCSLVKSTWLKHLDENDDYVFLSSRPAPERKIIGFNTPDNYESVPLKYVEFFKKADDSYFGFDWVYFCDDDTFVFPKRLRNLLSQYDSKIPVCVGRKGIFKSKRIFKIKSEVIEFASGGAGFAISMPAMMELRKYLRGTDYNYRKFTFSDVTVGYWFKQTKIMIIDRCNVLKAQNPRHPENQGLYVNTIVSYHYCDESDFTQLYSYMKYDFRVKPLEVGQFFGGRLECPGGGQENSQMSTIPELPDPWTIKGKNQYFVSKAKRLLAMVERVLSEPRLLKKAPLKLLGKTIVSPLIPVIGYAKGANCELKKRALITYVVSPFYADSALLKKAGHSNQLQSIEIARAFNRLGYIVDIVDWLDKTFIPANKYDVFFGMHYNFERLSPYLDKSTIKIYYGTGAYWSFEIAAEQERIKGLKNRCGVEIKLPIRLKENNWVQIADATIVMGNQFVLDTYPQHTKKLFAIDNSFIPTVVPNLETKNFDSARRNFIWFGSTGLLHKGLDLVLEAFSELNDLDLWVCGPLQSPDEQEIVKIYRRELFSKSNIHPIGWTDIHSEKFRMLTEKCAYVILASCAEGMPGGVLNCMRRGLIPLVSREAGIDTERVGVTFKDNSVDEIHRIITDMSDKTPDICKKMAQEAQGQTCTRYSLESFSQNIERILEKIINDANDEHPPAEHH